MGVADLELNADGNQHDSMAPPPTTTPHQSSSPSSLESSEDVARRAGESGRMSLLNKNNDAGEQERKGSVGVIVGRKSQDDDAPVFVVKLAPSGPAFLDGTLSFGDELLCIDDVSCQGMSLTQITAMLVGTRGSFVKLTIRQDGCIKEVGLERALIPTPHGVETRSRADAPSQRDHVQNGHTRRHNEHIRQGRSQGQANRAPLEAPELIPLGTDVQMERGRVPWRSPLSPQRRDRSEALDGFRPNQPAALSARRSSPPPRPSMASSTGQIQTIRNDFDSPPRSSGPMHPNFGEISEEAFRASYSEVYTAAGVSRRAAGARGEGFNHLGSIPLSPSSFLELQSHNTVMATDVLTSNSPVYCWGSPETSNQPPAHPSHAISPDPFIYRPSSTSVSIHPDTRAGIGLIQDAWARAHPFVPTVGHNVARPMSPVLGHDSKAIAGLMPLPFNALQPNLSPPPPFPMGQYTAFPVLSPRIPQPRNVENGMTKPLCQGAALPPAAFPPTASRSSSHLYEKSAAPAEVKSVGLSDMQALKEICRRQAQQLEHQSAQLKEVESRFGAFMLQYAATQGKGARTVCGGDGESSGRGQGELIHVISSECGLPGSRVPPPPISGAFPTAPIFPVGDYGAKRFAASGDLTAANSAREVAWDC